MFHRGYQYDVIVALLEKKGHKMHLRTLKRRLSDLGLRRKGHDVKTNLKLSYLSEEKSRVQEDLLATEISGTPYA